MLEFHEVADVFPLMEGAEFDAFKEDIATNGLREPVWVHEGKILDGRNRARACEELGIELDTREWSGGSAESLVAFVWSENYLRRHLTSSQLAACIVDRNDYLKRYRVLAEQAEDRQRRGAANGGKRSGEVRRAKSGSIPTASRNGPSSGTKVPGKIPEPSFAREAKEKAAKEYGTNRKYVADAKRVKEKAPDLHEKVKNGSIRLPQAIRQIARDEKRAELEAKAKVATIADDECCRIIHGDCIEAIRSGVKYPVRLVFADPPYNVGVDYGNGRKADLRPDAEYLAWCFEWMDVAARTLACDGSMWVLIGDEYADEFGCMLRRAGLHRRAWIKWYETFGVNCASNFNRTSRHLFYMVKDPKRFVFNPDAVSRPSDRQAKYGDKRADPNGKLWDDVWGVNPPIPRVVGTAGERIPDFPTQLPLALLSAIVGCASEPGDLVLDPFSGSATTGVAALSLGRRYVGIERSAEFVRLSRVRLAAAQGERQ